MTTNIPMTKNTQIVEYSVTEAMLAELKQKYADVPADLSDKQSYEYVRKATAHLRGLRGDVEKRRKELKADALEFGRRVDSTAKEITAKIEAIEEPLATAKKEYDTAVEVAKREAALAEERRIDHINDRIAAIRNLPAANISAPSQEVFDAIAALEKEQFDLSWAMEFSDKASAAIADSIIKLNDLATMRQQQEQAAQVAAEEAKRKAAEEELARLQREKELAIEREALKIEQEKLQAEREAHQAAIKAEQERLEEERRAVAAEKEKIEAEERAKKEEQQRAEAEAAHAAKQKQVQAQAGEITDDYRAAANAMLDIIGNKAITKKLLDAIIDGNIPYVSYQGA